MTRLTFASLSEEMTENGFNLTKEGSKYRVVSPNAYVVDYRTLALAKEYMVNAMEEGADIDPEEEIDGINGDDDITVNPPTVMKQMKLNKLDSAIQKQIIGYDIVQPSPLELSKINDNLTPFGLNDSVDENETVNLPLPLFTGLWGDLVDEAIDNTTADTISKIDDILKWSAPKTPSNYDYLPGWQVYNIKLDRWASISQPPSDKVFFMDIETTEVSDNVWWPTCAVAMSSKGWLLWVNDFDNMSQSIPFGYGNVMVNYNTPYDRSYLQSEYEQKDTGNRFFDLMSAWVVSRGQSGQQRPAYKLHKSDANATDLTGTWVDETTANSLSDVYEHYYNRPLDKGVRDLIVNGASGKTGMEWSRDNMQSVIRYCIEDVYHTYEVFRQLYPEYKDRCPSLVAMSGHLLLGSVWCPMDAERYPGFYNRAEDSYQAISRKTNEEMYRYANEFYSSYMVHNPLPESFNTKPDLKKLSKSNPDAKKYNNESRASHTAKVLADLEKWYDCIPQHYRAVDWTVASTGDNKGVPFWFRKVVSEYKSGDLTLNKRFVPMVLGLKWRGEYLVWSGESWATTKYGNLPHDTERGANVTSVFTKGYCVHFETGIIKSDSDTANSLILEKVSTLNWVSMRKRVQSIRTERPDGFPVWLPCISPNGAISRRAADKILHVCSNPKKSRIGTEFKSMIAAPNGYKLVGADIDGQEMKLLALGGEKKLGFFGSTPLGVTCLIGMKRDTLEASTDIHSVMAKVVSMDRDNVKTLNYATAYGQGVSGATSFVLKVDPLIDDKSAKAKAESFISKFVGSKKYNDTFNGKYTYKGGLASDSFNWVEAIANDKCPRTPLLKGKMTLALAGSKDYKPSRVNWVVQSSGVDMRDMLILLVNYLYKKYNVDGRLVATIHDEIRTMVADKDVLKATYCLQIAHLYCWAAFIDTMNLDCIPAGMAWFSAVDVDTVLRKNPFDKQITPTQPDGVPVGYTISAGQLLEKINDCQLAV
jgi:DNA polymerase gamma 1